MMSDNCHKLYDRSCILLELVCYDKNRTELLTGVQVVNATLEIYMTIIRDGRNDKAAKDFAIVGVGGAGAKSATELSKVLGNPDDVISVDREMDELRTMNLGRRISVGYPVYVREDDETADAALVDKNDLFRLKTVIGKPPMVFVLAGLGGNTTLELMPSVLKTAMSTGASVLAIVTLPFSFEGRTRADTARAALDRIRETGCSLALIDADSALSNAAMAGDLAAELSGAKARVVMNVLSASSAESFGTLNTAPELLDAIKCGGDTFVSYASSEVADEYRKIAREAIKSPLTTGLTLSDADYVSVIVVGPKDMSIKALNAAVSIVQNEMSSDAVLSTSFIPNGDPAKANRLRISILAGRSADRHAEDDETETEAGNAESFEHASVVTNSTEPSGSITDEVVDLLSGPDWLNDEPSRDPKIPALL